MEPSNPASSLSQLSKKRKVGEKKVVRVKIEDKANSNNGDQLPPPPDSWSWRKYGQKPIRGSPYPRGYYRCSTAKGCTARKRVERCRDDASVLLITYTSPHNHNHKKKLTKKERQIQPTEETSASKVEEVKKEHEASYVITADRSAPSYSLYNCPISRLPYDIDDGSDFYNALHDLPF